jgi:hypothetical protein
MYLWGVRAHRHRGDESVVHGFGRLLLHLTQNAVVEAREAAIRQRHRTKSVVNLS